MDCGPLLNLTNGRVDTSSGTKFMDRANYTCYVGYDLVGVSSRECQEDGHWSHSEPVCKSKMGISIPKMMCRCNYSYS